MSKEDVLWDDDGFKRRLEAACKLRGKVLKEVLIAAGASRYYLNKAVEGRSTNTVMKLARELDLEPQELAFGSIAARTSVRPASDQDVDAVRRLLTGQMFTAQQVMALLCLALNQGGARREEVTELMMRAAHVSPGEERENQPEPGSPDASPNVASRSAIGGISAK